MAISERVVLFYDHAAPRLQLARVLERRAGIVKAWSRCARPPALKLDAFDARRADVASLSLRRCVRRSKTAPRSSLRGPEGWTRAKARAAREDGVVAPAGGRIEPRAGRAASRLGRDQEAAGQDPQAPTRGRRRWNAFLAAHRFPLVEGGSCTFVWRGDADAVTLSTGSSACRQMQGFTRLRGHRSLVIS